MRWKTPRFSGDIVYPFCHHKYQILLLMEAVNPKYLYKKQRFFYSYRIKYPVRNKCINHYDSFWDKKDLITLSSCQSFDYMVCLFFSLGGPLLPTCKLFNWWKFLQQVLSYPGHQRFRHRIASGQFKGTSKNSFLLQTAAISTSGVVRPKYVLDIA